MAAGLTELLAEFPVQRFPDGTRTAADAARAIKCELGQIVKSLVFVAGSTPVMALVSGANRLDPAKLGALVGAPVAKADADLTRSETGFAIGGVPPFGHHRPMAVYMDRDLLEHETVWAAAGRPDSVFAISPPRLVELTGAILADLR